MNRIITIGREFGSGGRELGRRLSEKINIAYYDSEIIAEIAKRTARSEEYVQRISERKPLTSFPIHVRRSFTPITMSAFQQNMSICIEQHKLLRELSERSDCIIIGRCADYILREKQPFRIFVYADLDSKLNRCMLRKSSEENFSEGEMRRRMSAIDRERAEYHNFFSNTKWGAKESYDMLLNTSDSNIKKLSESLCKYLESAFD